MKMKSKRSCSIVIACMMLTVLAPAASFAATVTGVSLDKQTVYLEGTSNETVELKAEVKGSGGVSQQVKWTSYDPEIAKVDENGLVTAAGEGETRITAVSAADKNRSASCTIYVYDYALRICDGTSSNVVKTYTKAELDQLPKKKAEAYSSYNSYNTYQAIEEAEGPDVRDILAGAGYPADKLDPKSLIRFGAYDGLLLPYIVEDLFGTRYHYPHAKDCINGKVNAAALKDRVEVPVLIDFGYENDNRLCFGQLSPNEQSLTYSVKYMLGGKIIVNAGTPSTIAGGIKANIASGSTIQPGQEIKLSKAKMTSDPIYYTTDGKEPTRMSDLYNYNNYSNASLRLNKIKAPAKAGKFVVKARVMQYGRKPSPVQTFTYTVKPLPAKGKTFQVGTAKYKITKSARTGGTVTYMAPSKNTFTAVSVPGTVKIQGYTFSVTEVGSKAFAGSKNLKKVTVGTNVKTIGSKAFYKDKNLKTIVVKGKNLKKVGASALKGIHAKAKIIVPKAKVKSYQKLFKNKGQKKTVKIRS